MIDIGTRKARCMYLRELLLSRTNENEKIDLKGINKYMRSIPIEEYSYKTLSQDIQVLQEGGLEIHTEKERRVRYYWVVERLFDTVELKLLVDAVQCSRFLTQKQSGILTDKLCSLTDEEEAKNLRRCIRVTSRAKSMNEKSLYSGDMVYNAILHDRKITFFYCQWEIDKQLHPRRGNKVYCISPYYLVIDHEKYYMIGFDIEEGKIKHYRIDKMLNVEETDQIRDGKDVVKDLDINEYINQNFDMYGGEAVKLRIAFHKDLLGVFFDEFGTGVTVLELDEDRYELMVRVQVSPMFFGWITGLGTKARITGPEQVVKEYKDYLTEINAQY